MITQEELKFALSYDEDSGVFTWVNPSSFSMAPGDLAGRKKKGAHIPIMVNKKRYMAHRLAWLYVYGEIDDSMVIDHINGDMSDNRISNLRVATSSQNAMNRKLCSINTSGYKGVSYHKQSGKWQASIKINSKQKFLGLYLSPESAHNAYRKAAENLFGEFSRFS